MAKIQNNVQNKRKIKKFFRYLPVCLLLVSIVTLGFLHFLNVLPVLFDFRAWLEETTFGNHFVFC